ncbi:MAG: PEGA domain-containing protein [Bradymonadaceae bacterium]
MLDISTRWCRLWGVVLGATLVVLATGVPSVQAQEATASEPASIVVFKLEGNAARDQLRDELTSAMREQVQQSNRYQLVNDNPVLLSDVVVVLGCASASTTCLGKAAEHFGADYLIFGKFEAVGERTRASVRLFDPARSRYVRSFGRVLEKLSPPYQSFRDEVDGLLRTDQQRKRQRERQQEKKKVTSLKVTANIEEAKVRLDGEVVGETPLERRGISPGEYRVEVTREGYQSWRTVIQLDEGTNVNLQATLAEKTEPSGLSEASASAAPDEESTEESASGEESTAEPASDVEPSDESSADPPPSAQRSKAASWGPWVAIGLGGAAFIGSAIEFGRMRALQKDLAAGRQRAANGETDEFSADTKDCPGPGTKECEIISQGENAELAHKILIGAGGVMTAGGLTWLLFRMTGDDGDRAARSVDITFTGNGFRASWTW